jgi:hypothetical protein
MAGKWTDEDKKYLAKAAAVVVDMQKSYGKQVDLKTMLRGWQFLLEDDYTVYQISSALKEYMRQYSDIPAPADLIKILNPPEPLVTYAEYKAALEAHAKEGYPMFGYYGQIINKYNQQQSGNDAMQDSGSEPELLADIGKTLKVNYHG